MRAEGKTSENLYDSRLMFRDCWWFLWDCRKPRIHWASIASKDTSSLSGKLNLPMEMDSHVLMIKVRKGPPSVQESLPWQHLHLHTHKPSSRHTGISFLDKIYLCNKSLCWAYHFFLISQGGLKRWHKHWVSPSALKQISSLSPPNL